MHAKKEVLAGVIAALLLAGCGGSDGPTAPQIGSLRVSIVTTGGDQDFDGYLLAFGSGLRLGVRSSSTLVLNLVPGPQLVALEGVAENCTVAGTHPLTVTIAANDTAHANFAIVCYRTGIEITVRTTGSEFPARFDAVVGTERETAIDANGSATVSRIRPGSHAVSLRVPANCRVTGSSSATVVVTSRAVTPVMFDVACVRTDKRLAFVLDSIAGNAREEWILVADANGTQVTQLVRGHDPSWSPDGTKLVYADFEECYDFYYSCTIGLAVIDTDTRRVTRLATGGIDDTPSWSPDGKFIAFSRSETGGASLHLFTPNGPPVVKLATPEVTVAAQPSWSPDSRRIVFQCVFGRVTFEICVINRDGTGFTRLTNDAALDRSPAWSPDGSRIAFTTNRFTGESVALMTTSGSDITQLTTGSDPAWVPNGSRLIFARSDGLFTMGADGSNPTRFTTGRHRAPAWRP